MILTTIQFPTIISFQHRPMQVPSHSLRVGQIILLENDEEIPCDCVILTSSDVHGHAYIQTTNIDGETDYKLRKAPASFKHYTQEQLSKFRVIKKMKKKIPKFRDFFFVGNWKSQPSRTHIF